MPGEVELFEIVVETGESDGVVRPITLSRECNQRRAKVDGVDLDKLANKRRVTPHTVGKIIRTEWELPKLEKDRDGARYSLRPDRLARTPGREAG